MTSSKYGHWLAALLVIAIAASGLLSPAEAGEGHDDAGTLEHVVSLEGKSGVNLLQARLYNDNRLLYALVVTATMAVLGIVVAQVTELILKMLGIK